MNKKLMLIKDKKKLAVLDIDRKRAEMEFGGELTNIVDFRLFGDEDNKIVSIADKGDILLSILNYDLKKVISKARHKIKLDSDRRELLLSVSACDQGRYIVVTTIEFSTFKSSRMIILEVKGRSLVKLATLDERDMKIDFKYAFEFWRSLGNHKLWVGLSSKRGFVHLYDFETESGEFRELQEKRIRHQEDLSYAVERFGDKLYYIGRKSFLKVISLTQSSGKH